MPRVTKTQTIQNLRDVISQLRSDRDLEYEKAKLLEKIPKFDSGHLTTLLMSFEHVVDGLCHVISDLRQLKR